MIQWVTGYPDDWEAAPDDPVVIQDDNVQIRQVSGGASMRRGTESSTYIFTDRDHVADLDEYV